MRESTRASVSSLVVNRSKLTLTAWSIWSASSPMAARALLLSPGLLDEQADPEPVVLQRMQKDFGPDTVNSEI